MQETITNTLRKVPPGQQPPRIEAYRVPVRTKFKDIRAFYEEALRRDGWTNGENKSSRTDEAVWHKGADTFVLSYLDNPLAKATYVMITLCAEGCVPAPDGDVKRADNKPYVNAVDAKELSITAAVSDSPDFINEWMSTGSKHAPYLPSVHETKPGQTLYCAFLIGGYSAVRSSDPIYDVVVHWKLIKPDGSVMFDQPNYAKARGRMPQVPGFVMADNALDFVLDAEDPPGRYRLEAEVEDRVSLKSAKTSYEINLRPGAETPGEPAKAKGWDGKSRL